MLYSCQKRQCISVAVVISSLKIWLKLKQRKPWMCLEMLILQLNTLTAEMKMLFWPMDPSLFIKMYHLRNIDFNITICIYLRFTVYFQIKIQYSNYIVVEHSTNFICNHHSQTFVSKENKKHGLYLECVDNQSLNQFHISLMTMRLIMKTVYSHPLLYRG